VFFLWNLFASNGNTQNPRFFNIPILGSFCQPFYRGVFIDLSFLMTDKSLISGRQRIQGDLNLSGMLLRGKMRQCGYVKVEKA